MGRLSLTETKAFPRYIVFFALAVFVALSAGCKKSQQHQEAPSGPQTFASPSDASTALYNAAKSGDTKALLAIFGSDASDLILSGDPVQDKAGRDYFTSSYDEMHRWGKRARRRQSPLRRRRQLSSAVPVAQEFLRTVVFRYRSQECAQLSRAPPA